MKIIIRMVDIYRLLNEDGVFYVGKTTEKENRLRSHKERFGKDITMEIITSVVDPYSSHWELFYIKQYLNCGYQLKNKTKIDAVAKLPPYPESYYLEKLKENEEKGIKPIKNITTERLSYKLKESSFETKKLIKENKLLIETNNNLTAKLLFIEKNDLGERKISRWGTCTEIANYIKNNPSANRKDILNELHRMIIETKESSILDFHKF